MAFQGFLKQSTAVDILLGPFLDEDDGKTAETALTISQADVKLSKNGQTLAQKSDVTAASHDANGYYNCELGATDTNTVGQLTLICHESGALPVRLDYHVVEETVYAAMYAASAAGFATVAAVSDVKSELVVISDAVDAVSTKIDSDAALADADHDKTQSDVALLTAPISDIESSLVIVKSDVALLEADHDKTQSDIADLSTKIDSDAVVDAAAHTKTQSDIVLLDAPISDIESSLVIVKSDLVVVTTGTTAIESELIIVHSETTVIQSDAAAIETDTGTTIPTKLDSDATLDAAAHVKTQSDIALIGGDATLAKQDSIISDILLLSGKIDSDAVLADADHDKTQSDIALISAGDATEAKQDSIISDIALLTAPVSDIESSLVIVKSDAAAIETDTGTTIPAKLDSDAVLEAADHDKTQSDIALIAAGDATEAKQDSIISDIALLTAPVSDIESSLVVVKSDLVVITSDTTAIESEMIVVHSETTVIQSDAAEIETDTGTTLPAKLDSDAVLFDADHDKTQSDLADLSTKIDSDATLADADHDKTQSDIALVSAGDATEAKQDSIISDILLLSGKQDSDMVILASDHAKTQSDIALISAGGSDWTAGQRTTILSDLAALEADHDKTQSDILLLSGKVDSDATLDAAAHTKTQSDIALLDAPISDIESSLVVVKSDLVIVVSDAALLEADHDKTQSDIALLSTKIDSDALLVDANHTKTQSDVALLTAPVSDLESSLVIVKSDLVIVASDTAAIETDTGTTLPTKLDSDAVVDAAAHAKTQSDIADVSTKIDSDAVLADADHDKTQSDIALVATPAQVNEQVLDVINVDTLVAGVSVAESLRRIGARAAGEISNAGSGTETVTDWAGSVNTIVYTVDEDGNISAVVFN